MREILFQLCFEFAVDRVIQQAASAGECDLRNVLLNGAACDAKEVFSIRGSETAFAVGDVGSGRKGGTVALVDEEFVTARALRGVLADPVGEVDGFLVVKVDLETRQICF